MLQTMIRFWWETQGQNVPQAQLRHLALGPNLPKHLNAHSVTIRPSRTLISLSWVTVGLDVGPRLSLAIAPWVHNLL